MAPVFGMAGLAETGEAFDTAIAFLGFVLLIVVAAVGFFRHSGVASGIAMFLAIVLSSLYLPPMLFFPSDSSDPDVAYWASRWRGLLLWWGLGVAGAVAASVRALIFDDKRIAPAGVRHPESHPGPEQ